MNLCPSSPWRFQVRRGNWRLSKLNSFAIHTLALAVSLACLFTASTNAFAQENSSDLPDAPQAASSSQPAQSSQATTVQNPQPGDRAPQTKRILGIIPNFRSVSTDEKLPPQTVKEKFMDATQDSFDYSAILIPGIIAGESMASKQYPEFRQGALGFGRYFWHSAVDQTSENYWVEFIVPAIVHEDTRYYTLGRGGFFKRTGYALSRAIITRTDSGRPTFNSGEVVGAAFAAALSNAYYPARERSFSNTGQQWGLDVGIDAATLVGREFWPDINRKLFRGKD